jgi:hypothetical protein
MPIKINGDSMGLEIDTTVLATPRKEADDRWEVSHWQRFFDCNQAITALTIAELLKSGYDSADPLVLALHEELR